MFHLSRSKTRKCFYNEGKKKNSQRSAQLLMTRSDPVMTAQRMRYIERDNIAYNNHGSICPEKTGISLSVTRDGQLNRNLQLQVPPSLGRLFSYNLILHGLHNQPLRCGCLTICCYQSDDLRFTLKTAHRHLHFRERKISLFAVFALWLMASIPSGPILSAELQDVRQGKIRRFKLIRSVQTWGKRSKQKISGDRCNSTKDLNCFAWCNGYQACLADPEECVQSKLSALYVSSCAQSEVYLVKYKGGLLWDNDKQTRVVGH